MNASLYDEERHSQNSDNNSGRSFEGEDVEFGERQDQPIAVSMQVQVQVKVQVRVRPPKAEWSTKNLG